MLGTSILGVMGGFFILFSYVYFPQSRKPSFTLIAQLAAYDSLSCVAMFLSLSDTYGSCIVQSFMITFFQLGGALMTVVIANFLYVLIVTRQHPPAKYISRNFVIVNVVCLVLSCLPFATGSYGNVGLWCWITESDRLVEEGLFETPGVWWRFICFYVPLWMVVAYNIYIYRQLLHEVKKTGESHFGTSVDGAADKVKYATIRLINRLKWYPIILGVCYFPATVLRIYEIATPHSDPRWLVNLALMGRMSAFFNAFAYGYSILPLWQAELKCWSTQYPFIQHICCCLDLSGTDQVPGVIGQFSVQRLDSNERREIMSSMHERPTVATDALPEGERPSLPLNIRISESITDNNHNNMWTHQATDWSYEDVTVNYDDM